jgi:hypothetical protein
LKYFIIGSFIIEMAGNNTLRFAGLAFICLIGCVLGQPGSDYDDDNDTTSSNDYNDMGNSSDYSLGDSSNNLMNVGSGSMNSIPMGNYQLAVLGSSLPPINTMFDSNNF